MRKSAVLFVALGLVVGMPATVASPPAASALLPVPPLKYSARTLANGAKLYAIPDERAAKVTVNIWYGVGQRDDPPGRGGFAHLFEHLMFKTTRNLPGGTSLLVSEIGGSTNASTLFDYTAYVASAPANQLEALLWMEGERLRNLVIDQRKLESERDVVKEELRQRIYARPYGRILYLLLSAFTFTGHPYARPIGGTIADLDQATLADVRAFHEAYYRPDNAIFVISGNFDPAEMNRWADRYIGSIPRPDRPIPRDPATGETTQPIAVDAYAPNVPLPALIFAWRAPSADDPDAAGMALIETILARGASSRLRRALIDEKGVASDVILHNLPSRDGHSFAIVATLAKDQTLATAEAAMAAEIARLRDAPLDAAELRAAKNALFGDALAGRETAGGRAFALGDGAALTGDPRLADTRLAIIRDMDTVDVQRVARTWLADDRRITIRYRDESLRPPGYDGDAPPREVGTMGPLVPPASRPPVIEAAAGERVAPPAPGVADPRKAPALAERRLANGLRVIVAESTDVPMETLTLVVDGGDAADPAGQAGTADLLAAIVPRGAGEREAQDIAAAIAALGGSISTDAGPDATTLSLSLPAANAEAGGALLADIAIRPTLEADELGLARRQQSDALAVAAKQPMATAVRLMPAIMFQGSPYAGIPSAESLAAVTRDAVVAAHRERWTPGGTTLILAGSLGAEEGFTLAERLFGGWSGDGAPPPPQPRSGIAADPRVLVVDMPGAAQAAVLALMRAPLRSDESYRATEIANAVLGGGRQAWLSNEIRVKRGLSYGAGSMLDTRRDATLLVAATQTKTESAPEVAALVMAQIQRLEREPADAAAIADRAAYLLNAVGNATERTGGLADHIAGLVATGTPLDRLRADLTGGHATTPAEVAAAITDDIGIDRATLLIVGDSSAWIDELRAAYPGLELIDRDGKPVR